MAALRTVGPCHAAGREASQLTVEHLLGGARKAPCVTAEWPFSDRLTDRHSKSYECPHMFGDRERRGAPRARYGLSSAPDARHCDSEAVVMRHGLVTPLES
jgi:hypothetical protein